MALIDGGVSTADTVSDERPKSWGDVLHVLIPDDARFVTLFMKLKDSGALSDPEHSEFELDDRPWQDLVNNGAGYTAGDVSIVVDNGSYFRINDVVKVPRTLEQLLVTNVVSNTLTVKRGWGGTSGAALVDNDPLMILTTAMAEASSIPVAKSNQLVKRVNYSQILRESVDISRTLMQSITRPGDRKRKLADLRMMALRRGKHSMERVAIAGEAKEDLTGADPQRMAGGVIEFAGNVLPGAGALDLDHFDWIAGAIYDQGTAELSNKVCLIGPAVRKRLGQIVRGNGMIRNDEQASRKFGFRVERLETQFGELALVQSNVLVGSGGPAATGATAFDGLGGYIVAACLDKFKVKFMQDLVLLKDRQANDYDGVKEEYLAEYTFSRACPKSHAVIKGITS